MHCKYVLSAALSILFSFLFQVSAAAVATSTTPPPAGRPYIDARHLHHRLYAIVPIIGKGTPDDPKRPLHAPLPRAIDSKSRTGILAYAYEESDDGKFALVEFVAADPGAFKEIQANTSIQSFLKGASKKEDLEIQFKKYKKDFDFKNFGVRMP